MGRDQRENYSRYETQGISRRTTVSDERRQSSVRQSVGYGAAGGGRRSDVSGVPGGSRRSGTSGASGGSRRSGTSGASGDSRRSGTSGASGGSRRSGTSGASGGSRRGGISGAPGGSRWSDASGATGGSRYAGASVTGGQSGRSAAQKRGRKNVRRQRRKKRTAAILCLILVICLVAGCGAGVWFLYGRGRKTGVPQVSVSLESLDSPYAILLDAASGSVIASKNGDDKIYPASMAKVMTVYTAISHIGSLDQTVTMSYDYYDALYAQDASRAGFDPGEEAKLKDLLYGALLPSGAECCMPLALEAAGSEEAFAELMNQTARELGLTQTHFVNCTGLHSDDQYSTPHEIGLILQAALKNKTFRQVFMTHSYTVGATNLHPDGFTFWSSMFKNMQSETVIGGEIMGGKTGYTQEAGHCLVSMAEIEGREYILVTAGWASNPRTEQYHINDAFLGYNALGRAIAEQNQ